MTGTRETNADMVKKLFSPLKEEFGITPSYDNEDEYGVTVICGNASAALEVSWEKREGIVQVQMIKLKDGKIPPYSLDSGAKKNYFWFTDLLKIRNPKYKLIRLLKPFSDKETVLERYVELLRKHAADVMKGDFSAIKKL